MISLQQISKKKLINLMNSLVLSAHQLIMEVLLQSFLPMHDLVQFYLTIKIWKLLDVYMWNKSHSHDDISGRMIIFFLMEFTPCKAEQPLQNMELQGKEA